jgi:hypothetical protein
LKKSELIEALKDYDDDTYIVINNNCQFELKIMPDTKALSLFSTRKKHTISKISKIKVKILQKVNRCFNDKLPHTFDELLTKSKLSEDELLHYLNYNIEKERVVYENGMYQAVLSAQDEKPIPDFEENHRQWEKMIHNQIENKKRKAKYEMRI